MAEQSIQTADQVKAADDKYPASFNWEIAAIKATKAVYYQLLNFARPIAAITRLKVRADP
ncbi:hypothetical protein [Bacillus thermotolerans]|uniref:Uncharacterized protein n=1 Tax=Bacillus thermotolerans TaxID=1221996 RepID=A0A0F5HVN3_BACTR|nr:hypothetical protein [Bacillus thermotolerans]KKB37449.1 hypothetical protein QY97_00304 [Bacillus thermotolerans]KKB39503.1 hypothetical protein QY95_02351 [Bacillus thermotolerans]